MKKIDLLVTLFLCLLYLELLFGLIFSYTLTVSVFVSAAGLSVVLWLLLKILPEKIQKTCFFVVLTLISILFCVQLCTRHMFGFYFDFGLFSAAGQVATFWKEIFRQIWLNIGYIYLILFPLSLCAVIHESIDFTPFTRKGHALIEAATMIAGYASFVTREDIATELSIVNYGVMRTFVNEFKTPEESAIISNTALVSPVTVERVQEEAKVPEYHVFDIDFENAPDISGNIAQLNDYFENSTGTLENDFTDMFEGKNLILILGESFNEVAVSEQLTPTLYKMIHEGFQFTNYYSTSYNSTLGGEFQLLNGMFADSGALGIWKAGTNQNPLGIAEMFKNAGYNVRAYHDNTYTYMDRNQYLASVGFDNYTGCGNGLETGMNCRVWTESDLDMVNITVPDYAEDEPFFTYYVTVSGHGPYTYDTNQNEMGVKYREWIESMGYSYSETNMCYLSSMVELDRAMESMIYQLEEKGQLDNTVIVLAGDHWPYYLNSSLIQELCGEYRDENIGVCKNSLIIYNSAAESVVVEKAGNTMDVLPTIYNLFGIDYDSRLIPGKDLLSEAPGFAIFGNSSWVSDYGTYNAASGVFEQKEGMELPDEYVKTAISYVKSQIALTNKIFHSDYYNYIYPYINKE